MVTEGRGSENPLSRAGGTRAQAGALRFREEAGHTFLRRWKRQTPDARDPGSSSTRRRCPTVSRAQQARQACGSATATPRQGTVGEDFLHQNPTAVVTTATAAFVCRL